MARKTRSKRPELTPEQKRERDERRIAQARQRLEEGVKQLIGDPEAWRYWLRLKAAMHRYSFNNLLLILSQCPDATMVAGSKRWRDLGRHIKGRPAEVPEGEYAIWILAPFSRARDARQDELEAGLADPDGRVRWTTYRPVPVYDISQTAPFDDTPELPTLPPAVPLEGDSPELQERYQAMVKVAEKLGYTVHDEVPEGGAEADIDPAGRVRVRPDRSTAHRLASLIHEVAHGALGHTTDMSEYRQHRGRMEVEAESVAYLVAEVLGVDSSSFAFTYIAGWSRGNPELVEEVAKHVDTTCSELLRHLEAAGYTPAVELD
jgi:nucleotide-binding universal stress UspA family protein